jgi:hypothetical protein
MASASDDRMTATGQGIAHLARPVHRPTPPGRSGHTWLSDAKACR